MPLANVGVVSLDVHHLVYFMSVKRHKDIQEN